MEVASDHLKKVLVIDDEHDLCVLLTRKLQNRGIESRFAQNIKDGIIEFNDLQPGYLILDHNLPDGFGLDFIKTFKALKPNVKVIIISAMTHLGDQAIESGADHFSPKPISFADIERFIETH